MFQYISFYLNFTFVEFHRQKKKNDSLGILQKIKIKYDKKFTIYYILFIHKYFYLLQISQYTKSVNFVVSEIEFIKIVYGRVSKFTIHMKR